MGMRGIVRAFVKITPPNRSRFNLQGTHIFFHEGVWDEKLDKPGNGSRDLGFNDLGLGVKNFYMANVVFSQPGKVGKSILSPFRVHHIGGQHGSAAIELKVKVSAIPAWLNKKLHAAVLVNRVLVAPMDAPHISILDAVQPVEAFQTI